MSTGGPALPNLAAMTKEPDSRELALLDQALHSCCDERHKGAPPGALPSCSKMLHPMAPLSSKERLAAAPCASVTSLITIHFQTHAASGPRSHPTGTIFTLLLHPSSLSHRSKKNWTASSCTKIRPLLFAKISEHRATAIDGIREQSFRLISAS